MSKILVFGATGQVGTALKALLGDRAIAIGRGEADFSHPESLLATLDRLQPSAIFNASAYTQVDLAETDTAAARVINATAPQILARWAASHGVPLVHYSTDYVFAGTGTRPWTEKDQPDPVNAYGRTKLEGERLIAAEGGKYLIFRTSWVYDAQGKNFFRTMVRLGRERPELRVVSNQHGAPCFAPDIARASLQALERAMEMGEFPSGIYHLCNSGETTWHGFATRIFESLKARGLSLQVKSVEPIPASLFPTPARRPENSRLDCRKATEILRTSLPDWSDGLERCISEWMKLNGASHENHLS
ncbi:MAG: dTDP-4-dehydrorhamnose reductase [Bdellovibrionota bacterium]